MKKEEIVKKLTIDHISHNGKGVGRYENKVVFVKGAVPNDVVDVCITKKKKNYWEAFIKTIEKPSQYRQTPFCTHFDLCGGCKWQHMSYIDQLRYKEQYVEENLEKLTQQTLPKIQSILPSENTTYYRNKLEFTFSNFRWLTKEEILSKKIIEKNALGFHIPNRFDKILDIDHCYLQREPSNAIRNAVKEYAIQQHIPFFDLKKQTGLLRNLIIRTTSTGEVMVILQVYQKNDLIISKLLSYIKDRFPQIVSLMYVINSKRNDSFSDTPVHLFSGREYIQEKMGNIVFRIGPRSFYQTNTHQAYQLYEIILKLADLTGTEIVYDLYTGVGTIGIFLAKYAKKIVGLEYIPEAIENAKTNARINDIKNITFFTGDIQKLITDEFIKNQGHPDIIITDPPRTGMHPKVIHQLMKLQCKKIIYISCNVATQARDLKILCKDDLYKIVFIQPVDMFPHTQHIENVVVLKKNSL